MRREGTEDKRLIQGLSHAAYALEDCAAVLRDKYRRAEAMGADTRELEDIWGAVDDAKCALVYVRRLEKMAEKVQPEPRHPRSVMVAGGQGAKGEIRFHPGTEES